MNAITLKANEHRRIRGGHHWVFSNEIAETGAESGAVVEVRDASGRVFGHGFYNAQTLIAARLFSRRYGGDTTSYLRDAIRRAARLRARLYPTRTAYRLVFSESDFLPGLIIDRYNSTYVLQVHCLGMERQLGVVIDCLRDEFGARCVLTRHDPHFRRLEGLTEEDTVCLGTPGEEVIDDGAIRFRVGFDDSQKTGFYFDQAGNRALIERYCDGRSVLDAYCHHGGFGLHAAHAGARQVICVDSSAGALAQAEINAHANGLAAKMRFMRQDVFGFLADAPLFDVVLIDPPAFAKSRKQLPAALKGYEKLNRLALSRVAPDGLLVTSSCSHHLDRETFVRVVSAAAAKAGRELQMLHYEGAAPDHPVLPAMPETQYLKCAVFLVLQ
ncbi:MAG: class I SAM-dependent rRNA methyltransferase [Gammaproteobacteria bacterium]|nr:class I SAM-dependent rRNA methyltransferase [Gammaproteobacteria bacterium]